MSDQEKSTDRSASLLDSIGRKVVILSLAKTEPGITTNDLTLRALDTFYMDYFGFSEAYNDLVSQGLLMESVRKGEERVDAKGEPLRSVDLTPEGEDVLKALFPQLPLAVRRYLEEMHASRTKAHDIAYIPEAHKFSLDDGRYRCYLALREGKGAEIFHLSLVVPTASLAEKICQSFLKDPSSIYLGTLRLWESDL